MAKVIDQEEINSQIVELTQLIDGKAFNKLSSKAYAKEALLAEYDILTLIPDNKKSQLDPSTIQMVLDNPCNCTVISEIISLGKLKSLSPGTLDDWTFSDLLTPSGTGNKSKEISILDLLVREYYTSKETKQMPCFSNAFNHLSLEDMQTICCRLYGVKKSLLMCAVEGKFVNLLEGSLKALSTEDLLQPVFTSYKGDQVSILALADTHNFLHLCNENALKQLTLNEIKSMISTEDIDFFRTVYQETIEEYSKSEDQGNKTKFINTAFIDAIPLLDNLMSLYPDSEFNNFYQLIGESLAQENLL